MSSCGLLSNHAVNRLSVVELNEVLNGLRKQEESNRLLRLQSEIEKEEDFKFIEKSFRSRIVFEDQITPSKTEQVVVVVQGFTDSCNIQPVSTNIARYTKSNILYFRPYGFDTRYEDAIEPFDFDKDVAKFEEYMNKYVLEIGNKVIFYGMSFGARYVFTSLPKFKDKITNIVLNSPEFKLAPSDQAGVMFILNNNDARELIFSDEWYTLLDKFPAFYSIVKGVFPNFPYYLRKDIQTQFDQYPISRANYQDYEEELATLASILFKNQFVFIYNAFFLNLYNNSLSELDNAGINFIEIGDIKDTVTDEQFAREELRKLNNVSILELESLFDIQGKVTIDGKEYNLDQLEGKNSYSVFGNNPEGPPYHASGSGYHYGVKPIDTVNKFIENNLKL
jgi:hypothetical protein